MKNVIRILLFIVLSASAALAEEISEWGEVIKAIEPDDVLHIDHQEYSLADGRRISISLSTDRNRWSYVSQVSFLNGDIWEPIASHGFDYQKYEAPEVRVYSLGDVSFIVYTFLAGTGTGTNLVMERWFLVGQEENSRPVIEYNHKGYEHPWVGEHHYDFTSQVDLAYRGDKLCLVVASTFKHEKEGSECGAGLYDVSERTTAFYWSEDEQAFVAE